MCQTGRCVFFAYPSLLWALVSLKRRGWITSTQQTWESYSERKHHSHDSTTKRIPISVHSTNKHLPHCHFPRSESYVLTTMVVFSKHLNRLDPKQQYSLLTLLLVILLFRSRLITGPRDVFTALKKAAGIQKPTLEELEQARQQLYRKNLDGTKNLLVTYRGRISEVSTVSLEKSMES